MVSTKHPKKRPQRRTKTTPESPKSVHGRKMRLPTKIEHWPIERLIPYPKNAWKHDDAQVSKIKASMEENGWTNPILVDETDMILAGHGRRLAALELKAEIAPVIRITHLTKAQKLAYRLADNRLTLDGKWDDDLLDAELRALEEMGYDLELTGFELDELTARLEAPDEMETPAPQPPKKPVSILGDLWILGRHRLLCGDSGDVATVDRLLDGANIHLVNTDPPYNVTVEPRSNLAIAAGLSSFKGLKHHQRFDLERRKSRPQSRGRMRAKDRPLENDFVTDKAFNEMLHAWFGNIARVLVPGGSFYIWGGYANVANYPPVLKATRLYFSQWIIWDKQHPVLTRKDFMGAHEVCFYGWREGAGHHFYGPSNIPDLWPVKKVNPQSMIHLTEKPVELARRALQYSSKRNANVLDLFGGSGSTLMACEDLNRTCFMMDKDRAYSDVIVLRWQEATGEKAILANTKHSFEKVPATRKSRKGR